MKINIYYIDEPNLLYLITFLGFFGSLDDPLNRNLCNSEYNVLYEVLFKS